MSQEGGAINEAAKRIETTTTTTTANSYNKKTTTPTAKWRLSVARRQGTTTAENSKTNTNTANDTQNKEG